MRISLDAYLYFDEHWADAMVNGGCRRLVASYKDTRSCQSPKVIMPLGSALTRCGDSGSTFNAKFQVHAP